MPAPFVHLSPELLEACRRGIVLTPTDRLRRELVRAYDAWMASQGHHVWAGIDAFSLDVWFGHVHRRRRAEDPNLPGLLDPTAELLLWQETAADGHEALATLARDAWALAWQWRMPLDEGTLGRTENGRLFHRWVERFARGLADRGKVTRAQLPRLLTDLPGIAPEYVCCFGFESTPAAVGDYFGWLRAAGTVVVELDDPGMSARSLRVELPDRRAELAAAAQWCRELLLQDPCARIGVVVPDLAERHSAVERQFAACLEPVGSAGARRAFDVAGGTSLAEQPIWRDAMRWLRFCFDHLPVSEAGTMLASRYLDLPALPGLPPEVSEAVTLSDLAASTGNPRWRELSRAIPIVHGHRGLAAWLDSFGRALVRAGWTGRGAGSVQFQAFQQSRDLLAEAARASTYQRPCDAFTALNVLGRLARQRLFAAQRAAAPVQIMGYLETTGLRFTHLWVMGLTDEAWPGLVQANPLIPLSTQRRHGVPRIDPRGELEFAGRRLHHWQRSTGMLVVSHGIEDDAGRRNPSPLISHLPAVPAATLIPDLEARSHPGLVRGATNLVSDSREAATPLIPASVRGGSTLLRDQALCPFRRWAVHTLHLNRGPEPHGFPDLRDRGILVHEVLYRVLHRGSSPPAHPADVDAATLDDLLSATLAACYGRFPEPVRNAEQRRLQPVLRRWLEMELERPRYDIAALEHEVEVTLAGLTLKLRLDRVDRVGGELVVLDYKTGRSQPQRLFDQRLTEPQLPLYALADSAVRGVLFIELGDDETVAKGVAADGTALAPARLAALDAGWDLVRDRWRQQLSELASEILQGRAELAPVGPVACRTCHLHAFCRIHEHPGLLDDAGETAAEAAGETAAEGDGL